VRHDVTLAWSNPGGLINVKADLVPDVSTVRSSARFEGIKPDQTASWLGNTLFPGPVSFPESASKAVSVNT